jgi:hypothetical protein
MSSTLDSALNVIIPLLIVVVVIGFIWVKFLEPYFGKYLKRNEGESFSNGPKEIVYGDTVGETL